jgi:hypothetical protein
MRALQIVGLLVLGGVLTKIQWRTACERVSRERGYFQLSTASVTSIGERKAR